MWKNAVKFAIVALIARQCWIIVKFLDLGEKLQRVYPGKCIPIAGTEWGSEDIQTMSNGLAFISSGLTPGSGRRGRILLYDFNQPELGAVDCPITGDFDHTTFFPHGISIWENERSGEAIVFVAVHKPERVERFFFDRTNRSLVHQETIKSDEFTLVNDIAATSENTFYFTNSLTLSEWLQRFMVLLRLINNGNVGHYKDSTATILTNHVDMANGIFVSQDKSQLYVAGWGKEEVHIYNIQDNNHISLKSIIEMKQHVDNIHVDSSGDIWCTGQPIVYEMIYQFLFDYWAPTSSMVSLVRLVKDGEHVVTDVLVDDGSSISGSSVANRYKKQLIIGTVNHEAHICDLE